MWDDTDDTHLQKLVGKTVTEVAVDPDGTRIGFLASGVPTIYEAEGDCCSWTWIERVSGLDALRGSPILSVEDRDMPDASPELVAKGRYECLALYSHVIKTAKGECEIEYRNDSNGYYGGNLSLRDEDITMPEHVITGDEWVCNDAERNRD